MLIRKTIFKYWPVAYGVLVSIYEAYAFFSNSQIIPDWIKGFMGILALIGLIAKNYKQKGANS